MQVLPLRPKCLAFTMRSTVWQKSVHARQTWWKVVSSAVWRRLRSPNYWMFPKRRSCAIGGLQKPGWLANFGPRGRIHTPMTTERWQQIQKLFHEALERPEAERTSYVETSCSTDPALLSEVLSMLEEDARASSLL